MHQNVRKNDVVIVTNNAESETYPLPGKSPTFYITNQFCRVRYIERLLYHLIWPAARLDLTNITYPILSFV